MKNKMKLGIALVAVIIAISASTAKAGVLSVGSTGLEVSRLQTFLIENGFPIPFITSGVANKGYFGEQTETAVKMYQEEQGTNSTGVISTDDVFLNKVVLGAVSGPNTNFRTYSNRGNTEGGYVATTSTATTYTTADTDFNGTPTVISWLPNRNTTISISGTSTSAYIPKVGDVANVYFRNASTTAGATITFARADSGVDMQFAEATGGDLVLNGLDWAKFTFIRTSTTLVTVIFDEFTEAD